MGVFNGNSIYNDGAGGGGEINFIKDYDQNTTYFAGACVKHNGETYLFDSNSVVTGSFDPDKWKKIDSDELNKFITIEFTASENDYVYCHFAYNPFMKIVLGNINVKFTRQIQQAYNLNDLRIQFDKPFVGYGSTSSFSINSSNEIVYPNDSQVCCQLLDPDIDPIHSGVTFWTNGVSGVYGMFTCQIFAWMTTEHKNE